MLETSYLSMFNDLKLTGNPLKYDKQKSLRKEWIKFTLKLGFGRIILTISLEDLIRKPSFLQNELL